MQEKLLEEGRCAVTGISWHCSTHRGLLTAGFGTLGYVRRKGKKKKNGILGNIQVFKGYQISQTRGLGHYLHTSALLFSGKLCND